MWPEILHQPRSVSELFDARHKTLCPSRDSLLTPMSMNIRHAAALALVGWYLMTPGVTRPTETSPSHMLDPTVPFSLWTVNKVFDSAESCNAARDALNQEALKAFEDMKTEVGHRVLQEEPDHGTATIALFKAETYAQCIATDDPRLKTN
jgi:hypothetical protein